jgi:hypothetical protein
MERVIQRTSQYSAEQEIRQLFEGKGISEIELGSFLDSLKELKKINKTTMRFVGFSEKIWADKVSAVEEGIGLIESSMDEDEKLETLSKIFKRLRIASRAELRMLQLHTTKDSVGVFGRYSYDVRTESHIKRALRLTEDLMYRIKSEDESEVTSKALRTITALRNYINFIETNLEEMMLILGEQLELLGEVNFDNFDLYLMLYLEQVKLRKQALQKLSDLESTLEIAKKVMEETGLKPFKSLRYRLLSPTPIALLTGIISASFGANIFGDTLAIALPIILFSLCYRTIYDWIPKKRAYFSATKKANELEIRERSVLEVISKDYERILAEFRAKRNRIAKQQKISPKKIKKTL